ncbi:TauD/TfdA family dioxygenase [Massilia sp. B-10]|nr:TauD/TfdA family dioxygenase [Massilia sp. B-10]
MVQPGQPVALHQFANGGRDEGHVASACLMNAFFGDGGELDMDMLTAVRAPTPPKNACSHGRPADFLMLDNRLVAHGRMPFDGPRKIVVALGNGAQ